MTVREGESDVTRWRQPVGYELIREARREGGAVFYEARQRSTNRVVLLKVIPSPFATEWTLARCRREAAFVREVDDPGVVQVLDAGTTEGGHYVAYEFLEGSHSLAEMVEELRKEARLPAQYDSWCADFIAEVANTMAVVHDAGFVHRKLAASSILVTSSGESKVTSFELAQFENYRPFTKKETADKEETLDGEIVGVPITMSPEQAMGSSRIDRRSDVYSLGAVLYLLLTLHYPLQAKTTRETWKMLLTEHPLDPRQYRRGIPRKLASACMKALSKNPDMRYQSMTELASALRRSSGG